MKAAMDFDIQIKTMERILETFIFAIVLLLYFLLEFSYRSKNWSNKINAIPNQKDTEQAKNNFLSFFAMKLNSISKAMIPSKISSIQIFLFDRNAKSDWSAFWKQDYHRLSFFAWHRLFKQGIGLHTVWRWSFWHLQSFHHSP